MATSIKAEVLVLGSGPGGYTAAFRAADLGKKVVLVERFESLGGVCLNVGCIPSKALLHAAKVIEEAHEFSSFGISFGKPKIDIDALRKWKDKNVVGQLTSGLKGLASMRKVQVITGRAVFESKTQVTVTTDSGDTVIEFDDCIIATGSRPIKLPFLPEDPRIVDSTGALMLASIPDNMLVIGGGIIGLEMATVYSALGCDITIVELTPSILPGVDKDIASPLLKKMQKKCKILLETKVIAVDAQPDGLEVTFEDKKGTTKVKFAQILSAVGRVPNGKLIQAERAGITVDERGFIPVDNQLRTNVANIYAIGDICGNPMLAHKAVPEGKIAAEVICGKKHAFAPKCIPNVAYTDPEVAWVGLTEAEAKQQGIEYGKGIFPWAASGRSLAIGRNEGMTKVLFDKKTNKIIGAAIVGSHAGDLIAEAGLAIEMGCDAEDIALTIHPHPTLSETLCQATEVFTGCITDLPNKK